jgi:NAD(P)H-hydrate epimerase
MRRPDIRVVALDLPTGLDADTGKAYPICDPADVTVALGYPKAGFFAFPGAGLVGALDVVDIGIPAGLDDDVSLQLMTPAWAGALLPDRPASAHKGTFGRTLVIAGSRSYIGAASLAATAAGRAGAGLVTIAVPESLVPAIAARAAEPTFLPLSESSPGVVSDDAGTVMLDNMDAYDALLVGCGIGQDPATRRVVERLLYSDRPRPPTVVDADGLNILAMTSDWWGKFKSVAVLTPHPGEMARLTGEALDAQLPRDRVADATKSAARWSKTIVLKGAHTVVAAPDGQAMVSPFANPGLASAGTGDVLAGTIAGLLSQGLGMDAAASVGVYVHGASGERVRDDIGDAGMLASDLLPHIPRVVRDLKAVRFQRPT